MELSLLRYAWMVFYILMLVAAGIGPAEFPQRVTMATTAPPIPTPSFYLSMVITNRIYNDSLLNPNSPDYKKLYTEVNGVLNAALSCPSCGTRSFYLGVQAMAFSSGSVIAISTIMFQTYFINAVLLQNIFRQHIISDGGKINGLTINSNLVQVIDAPPSTQTTVPSSTTTTTTTTTTTSPIPTSTATSLKTTTVTTSNESTTITVTSHTSTSYKTTKGTSTASSKTMSSNFQSSTSPTQAHSNITTTTKPFSKTPNMHAGNTSTSPSKESPSTMSSSSTHLSSSITRRSAEPLLQNTTLPHGGDEHNQYEGVPGWAIALLVLACVILVLLIILLIIAIIRCCTEDKAVVSNDVPEVHTPYGRRAFKEPLSTPTYSPHTPQKSPVASSFEDPTKPRVNRTGMYIVNPENS